MTDNQIYFFNNLYNDKIIHDSIYEFKNKMYQRSIESQLTMVEFPNISFASDKFEVNEKINKKYGLIEGSRTYIINENIIPYYNKKQFADKYGYGKLITIQQIAIDYKTFNKRIMITRGALLLMNVSFISLKSESTIICRPPKLTSDTYKLDTDRDGNMTWDIFITFESQSDCYYANKSKLSLIINNKIPLSTFTIKNEIKRENKVNSYTMYYTFRDGYPNMYRTTVTKVNVSGVWYFEVPRAFINILTNISSLVEVYIFHDYKKIGSITYEPSADNLTAYFQLPFIKNPVPCSNIRVSTYLKTDGIKAMFFPYSINNKALYDNNDIYPALYPNIYNFAEVAAESDYGYFIEWYESSDDNANILFDNNVKDYMAYKGASYVTEIVDGTAPVELRNYVPLKIFKYDYDDYAISPMYPDIRKYNLDKIKSLMNDNPLRFNSFFNKFNNNRKYIHISTNGIIAPEIMSRSIMNNSTHISKSTDLYTFNEAHTFIKFSNSSNVNRPVQLFLDGRRTIPTFIYTSNYNTYVYLPKSKLQASTPICIDMTLSALDNKKEASIIFNAIGKNMFFPQPSNGKLFDELSSNDILFYNALTYEYIPKGVISFGIYVNQYKLTYMDKEINFVFGKEEISYLLTLLEEFYRTQDSEKVLLSKEDIYIPAPIEGFFKRINTKDLLMHIENFSYINMEIGVTNTNNYRYTTLANATTNSIITLANFREDPSPNRIRVYYGGILLDPNQYTYIPATKYGEDATVTLMDLPVTTDTTAMVEYVPYTEKYIAGAFAEAGRTSVFNYNSTGDNDIIDITEALRAHGLTYPINLKCAKFYQNGRRIPNFRIQQFNANNTFKINGITSDPETDLTNIRIDIVENDEAPYIFEQYSSTVLQ